MNKKQKKMLIRILISAAVLIPTFILDHVLILPLWVQLVGYLSAYAVIGYDILKKAGKGILKGQVFDENFLMAIASVGALCLGDLAEAAAVMLFYQVGELFQSVAVGKSRRNISALMDIRPDYANVEIDGKWQKVDPEEVAVGTRIRVNPGEKVPIDGVVCEGSSSLDTSALTGESVPRQIGAGDSVISGCINLSGQITVETQKEFGESTVAKILELVENSGMKKSRSENFITKFARYYTPAVCIAALAVALIAPVISYFAVGKFLFSKWVIRALTFLVISCPCALVISIPLGFFAGIGAASSRGILVKGSTYLEQLSKTGILVLDKTGTLTRGVFAVSEVSCENGWDRDDLLYYAACAEQASSHPIAVSLKTACKRELHPADEVTETAGYGIQAVVDGKHIAVGNRKLMQKIGVSATENPQVGTVVYVAVEQEFAGSVLISDQIKPNCRANIARLKKNGIRQTVMLTGDNEAVARDVAEKCGIDRCYSQLLPADKVTRVEELLKTRQKGEVLAFVGDGINDAPVLTRADIGIAMGALGSDAAIEAADVVLMDDDIGKITTAMKISRKTVAIVYENIGFALFVKFACLLLSLFGLVGMWVAIFADVGVMVLAVCNALRAMRVKKEKAA